jgi:HEAT repeat protein
MATSTGNDRSQPGSAAEKPGKPARPYFWLRLLVTFVICGGATYWASRAVYEHTHPSAALARALQSSDPDQRLAAVREISTLGPDENSAAVRALVPALSDPVAGIRSVSAEALGRVGSTAVNVGKDAEAVRIAVDGLLTALKDQDASVRLEAASALAGLAESERNPSSRGARGKGKAKAAPTPTHDSNLVDHSAIVAALLELLKDSDVEVRRIALLGVGRVASRGSGEPPEALYEAIEDKSPIMREAALAALSGFPRGLDKLIPTLLQHAEHDEALVQAACDRALARIQPSALSPAVMPLLIDGLKNRDRNIRLHLVSLVGRMSPDPGLAVPPLIAVLREADKSDERQMAGTMAMASHAGPAQEAAQVLGRIAPGTPGAEATINALYEVVQSGPPQRRAAAARALGRFGHAAARAVPGLIAYLQDAVASKQTSEDGPAAARSLAQIAPGTPDAKKAAEALSAAFKADFAPAREAAVKAIASFKKDEAGSNDLISQLTMLHENDRVPVIRAAAESALEHFTPPPSASGKLETSGSKPKN